MKKIILILAVLSGCLFASDELNIDNLFKKQIGLRSITSLSLLSTGNPHSYYIYPNIGVNGDLNVWNDTKQLYLNQTFIYTLTPNFDLLISGGGNYARQEYNNIISGAFTSKNTLNFDSLWIGFIYTGESIADFVPQIKFQTAIIQREKTVLQTKNFYFQSQNLEASLRGYSDPVVYSIYTGFGYNAQRKFKIAKIDYGNSIYFGGNLSIILSPKITLDLGAEQRFQTEQKINGVKNSEIRSIPTISGGSTYSINQDTAVSVSASLGGSSAAPDAIFGINLWKKILKIALMVALLPLFLKAEFVVKSYAEIKNEKVVRQNYEESCGAASLATLINTLDDNNLTELDLLKTMSGQKLYTDMVSFADLNDAVKKLGYESKSYKVDRKILENIISVPILVKIEDDPRFPHFVVIINHKGNYLQILDPSYGEYISSKREFYSVWDRYNKGGFALVVNPKKQLKDYKLNLPKSLNFEIEHFGF